MSACSRSISVTIEPIGSSTSGTQMSSGLDTCPKYGLGTAPPPRNVGGDGEDERGEQATQRRLGQRGCELDAALDARNGGDADHERGLPADVAVALLPPDPCGDGRQDRGERRR